MKSLLPFSFNMFLDPWALLLLLAVVVVFIAEITARAPGSISVSTGEVMDRVKGRRGLWLRRIPPVLRAIGLALLVIALARPVTGYQLRKDRADVIDIMLCVDVSGSMQSMDFFVGGERRDRLYVTKEAVRDFIKSRKQKPGDRYGLDRVGLVLYATYAWTACPLTLDYGVLEHELDRAEVNKEDPSKQRTAIGSAIGLAVSRLRKSEAKSKVIILLTDGINNTGEIDPLTAARLSKDYGIRIYTIGAGSTEGGAMPSQTIFGAALVPVTEGIDEETLKKIAAATGGKYYRATDTKSLESAYREINELETTEVELGDYFDYREGFLPYAVAGTAAVLASVFTRRRWFEPIP